MHMHGRVGEGGGKKRIYVHSPCSVCTREILESPQLADIVALLNSTHLLQTSIWLENHLGRQHPVTL